MSQPHAALARRFAVVHMCWCLYSCSEAFKMCGRLLGLGVRQKSDGTSTQVSVTVEAMGSGKLLLSGLKVPCGAYVQDVKKSIARKLGRDWVDIRLFRGQGGPEAYGSLTQNTTLVVVNCHVKTGLFFDNKHNRKNMYSIRQVFLSNRYLVTCTDYTTSAWELSTANLVWKKPNDHGIYTMCDFFFARAKRHNIVHICSMETGKVQHEIPTFKWYGGACISRDCTRIVFSGNNTLRMIDTVTWKDTWSVSQAAHVVFDNVSISPNNKLVAAVCRFDVAVFDTSCCDGTKPIYRLSRLSFVSLCVGWRITVAPRRRMVNFRPNGVLWVTFDTITACWNLKSNAFDGVMEADQFYSSLCITDSCIAYISKESNNVSICRLVT